jgi:hypothetical protein
VVASGQDRQEAGWAGQLTFIQVRPAAEGHHAAAAILVHDQVIPAHVFQ